MVGRTPWNTAFSADGSTAYVTNANDNTVSVLDTASRRVTNAIPLGSCTTADPSGMTKGTMFPQLNQHPDRDRARPGQSQHLGRVPDCRVRSS